MKELVYFCAQLVNPILMKMEWTEDHDIHLAKEVLVSEPYRFKSRAV